MFSGLSDRLPDVPDALRRGFEGSGREHVWSATQDDPRHHGSLSLTKLTQNSTWSSPHMVDKYKHLMSFHLKLFLNRFEQKEEVSRSVQHEVGIPGGRRERPSPVDHERGRGCQEWPLVTGWCGCCRASYNAPGAGLCFLSCCPLGPIRVWHDRWFPYKTERTDVRWLSEETCREVWPSAWTHRLPVQNPHLVCKSLTLSTSVSVYCTSMQNFISFVLFKYENTLPLFHCQLNLDLSLNENQKHSFLY